MIKKLLSPYAAILEQVADSLFITAHSVLRKVEDKISGWTDDLWAGDDE